MSEYQGRDVPIEGEWGARMGRGNIGSAGRGGQATIEPRAQQHQRRGDDNKDKGAGLGSGEVHYFGWNVSFSN